jgi:D-alanyl-lipoteichoic acid acyltransferase DltB (MBOAT superfamily)
MGTWFKDYLFYPISVSKRMLRLLKFTRKTFGDNIGKKLPVYLTTLIVWFATGIWHGAEPHFLVWGLINGAVIIVSEQISPLYTKFHNRFHVGDSAYYKAFMIFRTFWLMCFIRTFDVYANVRHTFYMYGSLFTNFSLRQMLTEGFSALGLSTADYIVAGIGTAIMIAVGHFANSKKISFFQLPVTIKWVAAISAVFAILILGIYGFGYDSSQFIYNKF